jgi:filamentous hemagglutinin
LADNNLSQIGGDVTAVTGDIVLDARTIDLGAATDSIASQDRYRSSQGAVTLGLSGTMVNTAQTVGQMGKAAGKTEDPRVKALAAAAAAAAARNAVDRVQDPKNNDSGVGLSLSVGASHSQSDQTQSAATARVSTVSAGRDVYVHTTGGTQDDFHSVGGQIKAGNNVVLDIAGKMNLEAAQNTASQHGTNRAGGGSVGIGIGSSWIHRRRLYGARPRRWPGCQPNQ